MLSVAKVLNFVVLAWLKILSSLYPFFCSAQWCSVAFLPYFCWVWLASLVHAKRRALVVPFFIRVVEVSNARLAPTSAASQERRESAATWPDIVGRDSIVVHGTTLVNVWATLGRDVSLDSTVLKVWEMNGSISLNCSSSKSSRDRLSLVQCYHWRKPKLN